MNSGTATLAQARSLDGLTTGVVTATIADTVVSDLLHPQDGLTEMEAQMLIRSR